MDVILADKRNELTDQERQSIVQVVFADLVATIDDGLFVNQGYSARVEWLTANGLTDDQIGQLNDAIFQKLEERQLDEPSFGFSELFSAYAAVPRSVGADQARRVVACVVRMRNAVRQEFYTQSVPAFAQRLNSEQRDEAIGDVLAAIQESGDPDHLIHLSNTLSTLGEPNEHESLELIMTLLEKATPPDRRHAIERSGDPQPSPFAMDEPSNSPMIPYNHLYAFSGLLEATMSRLHQAGLKHEALERIRGFSDDYDVPHRLVFIARALALLDEFSSAERELVYGRILDTLKAAKTNDDVESLLETFSAVPGLPTSEQSATVLSLGLLRLMAPSRDPFASPFEPPYRRHVFQPPSPPPPIPWVPAIWLDLPWSGTSRWWRTKSRFSTRSPSLRASRASANYVGR